MTINWIKEEEFWNRFETEYRSQKRFFVPSLVSKTSFGELCKSLPISLVAAVDENDGLGMCDRWFAVIEKDLLFTITCYKNSPDKLQIDFPYKDEQIEKYQWSFLEN